MNKMSQHRIVVDISFPVITLCENIFHISDDYKYSNVFVGVLVKVCVASE